MRDSPAHCEEFQGWMRLDGYAFQSRREYPYFLRRYAEGFGRPINPTTVRREEDVTRILADFDRALSKGGRGKGTFVRPDRGNLSSALRAYVRFVATFSASNEPAHDLVLSDVATPLRRSVTRLIRNTKVIRSIKRLYDSQCQLCGGRIELSPGRYYAEGHHLKALGRPHNGIDREDNVVCVCPNCHVRLDYGAVAIDPKELKILKHAIAPEFVDYHNKNCCSGDA